MSFIITDKTHEFQLIINFCKKAPLLQHQVISVFQKFHGFGKNIFCCLRQAQFHTVKIALCIITQQLISLLLLSQIPLHPSLKVCSVSSEFCLSNGFTCSCSLTTNIIFLKLHFYYVIPVLSISVDTTSYRTGFQLALW